MDHRTREYLRTIIGVALTMVPAREWRAFHQKPTGIREPAKDAIIERIVADIETHFEVERKEVSSIAP